VLRIYRRTDPQLSLKSLASRNADLMIQLQTFPRSVLSQNKAQLIWREAAIRRRFAGRRRIMPVEKGRNLDGAGV